METLSSRLVFIDESFCKTGMRREFGWSRRGDRVAGKRMGASWKTLSLIGAMRLGERPRLMTHRGAVNGRTFLRFVRVGGRVEAREFGPEAGQRFFGLAGGDFARSSA